MKYLLILGCTFALAISANSALANSIEKAAQTPQTTKISQANKSDDHHIKSSDSQTELYQLCQLAQTGNGNTIYYSNGKVMTSWAGKKGATWYYPNGKVITSWAGNDDATWYYSNGRVMTSWAGRKGATWYYSNGQIMTSWAGTDGATWYHPNGKVMTSSGNLISERELLYPCSYIK
jgi:antitoxin component YwqK of YwqJK toxin-antitoxin module